MTTIRRSTKRLLSYTTRLLCKLVEGCLRLRSLTPRNKSLLDSTLKRHFDPQSPPSLIKAKDTRLRIIIPFRDQLDLTKNCIQSLLSQSVERVSLDIVLVDNQSNQSTIDGISQFISRIDKETINFEQMKFNEDFNFSKICNDAAKTARLPKPDFLLFCNNDITIPDKLFIEKFVDTALRLKNPGCIGSLLLYPDLRIQHLFAAPGVKIIAAHPFKGSQRSEVPAYLQDAVVRVPAVTGALMLTPSEAFSQVGGFDENLPRAGQDIDLCMKMQQLGKINYTSAIGFAFHHESSSRRGIGIDSREVSYIYQKWGKCLSANPEYPSLLTRWSEKPTLKWFEKSYPLEKILGNNFQC